MLRIGFAEPAGFSEGASCPRGKRRTSMCGALRVLSAASAASEGPRVSKAKVKINSNSAGAGAGALWHVLRRPLFGLCRRKLDAGGGLKPASRHRAEAHRLAQREQGRRVGFAANEGRRGTGQGSVQRDGR